MSVRREVLAEHQQVSCWQQNVLLRDGKIKRKDQEMASLERELNRLHLLRVAVMDQILELEQK